MSDLVKRLRGHRHHPDRSPDLGCCKCEAADRIEELEGAVVEQAQHIKKLEAGCDRLHGYITDKDKRIAELEAQVTDIPTICRRYEKRIEELEAENERLREERLAFATHNTELEAIIRECAIALHDDFVSATVANRRMKYVRNKLGGVLLFSCQILAELEKK